MQIKVVFMGSPDFAVPALHALNQHYSVVGVVSQPDRPSGRGMTLTPPPVKVAAQALGIPVMQPEKLRQPEAMEQLQAWNPDLIIVAAFGQILKQEVLDLPKYGCLNIHASLLPRWRGAAPIQSAILAGDAETGITIMKMDAGLDTGPMIAKRSIPILPHDTGGSLFEKLSALGGDFLLDILPSYLNGDFNLQPQPEDSVTYAPMLKKEDGLLDTTQTAEALERRVRAFSPWPGTFLLWNDAPLKIRLAHVEAGKTEAGWRGVRSGLPAIGTSDGYLILDELQPAGKKAMSGKAFLQGARDWET